MKHYFAIFAILIVSGLSSCNKENTDSGKTPDSKQGAEITVNPTAVILESTQTSATFALTCTGAWTIEKPASWIKSVEPSSGNEAAEKLTITLSVEENDGDLRSTKLKIVCGEVTKDLTVSQAEAAGKEVLGQAYIMKAQILEDTKGFNMISDGDFEDTGDQAMLKANPWWALYSDRVEGGAASGDAYCFLNHDDIDENLGFQTVCTKPNTEYEVSAWFKANQDSGCPDVYFGVRIGTGIRPVNFEESFGPQFTTTWTKYSKTGNVGNNPISEVFAYYFSKEGYKVGWDNVVFKQPGDTQKSFGLSNMNKVGNLYENTGGDVTSADGCTAWDGGDGKIYFAFGRNVGDGVFATRENAFGWSTDGGKTIEMAKTDGKVVEIIPVDKKENGILPTAGITVGGRHWIHYQIIRSKEFAAPVWKSWGAGLAYSDDGVSWTRSDVSFDKAGNFMEVCFLKDGGYVYMFGSHIGRGNDENVPVADEHYMMVARCTESDMDKPTGWKYWNGADWVVDEVNAVPVIYCGTLGEFSVIKNETIGRFLFISTSLKRNAIVVRDAATPEGEWSGEHILYPFAEDEVLYAPSFLPVSASGNEVEFIISTAWGD